MIVDIIVLAVLLLSALISFIRGFIREVLTILGVAGGIAAAYFGGPLLSPTIKDWLGVVPGEVPKRLLGIIPYDILGDILSYGLIFIIVVIVLSVVSHILAETARAVGLGAIDRTLGVVFGLLRGILLLGVLYLIPFYVTSAETKADIARDSKTYVYVESVTKWLASFLPAEAVQKLEESSEEAKEEEKKDEEDGDALKVEPLDELKEKQQQEDTQEAPAQNGDGYSDEFRDEMNQLFQQDGAPPQPAPAPQPAPEQQPAPVPDEATPEPQGVTP
jgi:membrane protein required for colicin V production